MSGETLGWLRAKFVLWIVVISTAAIGLVWSIPYYDRINFIKAIAWPVALIVGILLFAFQPKLNRIFGLAKFIKKIKAGGVEMEISTEAIDGVRKQLQESVRELVDNARDEYDRMASVMNIYSGLECVFTVALPRILKSKTLTAPADLRGTIHVQDIVFPEYFYQIVNYYPKSGGSGRRFSQRYGIIGRSWRLGRSIGEGNAFEADKNEEEVLIKEWGMTKEEVRNPSKSRPAYLSVVLKGLDDSFALLGVLFLDSATSEAFGKDDLATKIAFELEECPEVVSLRKRLEATMVPLRSAAPNIDISVMSKVN